MTCELVNAIKINRKTLKIKTKIKTIKVNDSTNFLQTILCYSTLHYIYEFQKKFPFLNCEFVFPENQLQQASELLYV